jgi:ribosomal protein S6--L-glutamate ligase
VKIGILGWDDGVLGPETPGGEYDPDGPVLVEHGRRRGHETTLFTLENVTYVPGGRGMDVVLGGHPGSSFDAIISRAKLFGDDWRDRGLDWRDRVERLTMVSEIPGLHMFDSAEVWQQAYSKFLTMQKLAQAGLPVPPCRSATTPSEVELACQEWEDVIIKPSYGYRGKGVTRITDFSAQEAEIQDRLDEYGTMVCIPYYPTQWGEYRVMVAGEAVPEVSLKLPAVGQWRPHVSLGGSFERIDPPPGLAELALRAARVMGLTMTGLDILPTGNGFVILEANSVTGGLNVFGEETHRAIMDGVYDWVEKRVAAP